ncbi:MAG: hypothetical protein OXC63_08185 [Aestuariivita sp.]|nr:hypothetical protein [Aestuariivita sp.]MCY4345369.1 hypothetical protein [Aestuariivita sp.]
MKYNYPITPGLQELFSRLVRRTSRSDLMWLSRLPTQELRAIIELATMVKNDKHGDRSPDAWFEEHNKNLQPHQDRGGGGS